MELSIKSHITKSLETACESVVKDAVSILSKHYEFDTAEALRLVGVVSAKCVEPTKRKKAEKSSAAPKKPTIPLPWTGVEKEEWCYGLRPTHGLYSQCPNPRAGKGDGLFGKLCSTCLKQCEKNDSGKPNAGLVSDRVEVEDYVSPNGKKPVLYSVVMAKLNLSRERVMEECEKLGVSIPESEFVLPEKKRVRPAKAEEPEEKVEKKRGRPAKAKRQVSITTAEELLADLEEQGAKVGEKVASTKDVSPDTEEESISPEPEESENEESENDGEEDGEESESGEELDVVTVTINKKEYYMREDEAEKDGCEVMNESGEIVGRYKKTKKGCKLEK